VLKENNERLREIAEESKEIYGTVQIGIDIKSYKAKNVLLTAMSNCLHLKADVGIRHVRLLKEVPNCTCIRILEWLKK
jgi:hypothetical protein